MAMHRVRWRVAAALATVTVLVSSTAGPAEAETASKRDCRAVRLPVTVDPGGDQPAELSGDLCTPTHRRAALQRTVQVLVAGTAYGKYYWDFPYRPETYSYAAAANAAGFATFNFDRIGTGESTHPPSSTITIPSNAYTIHQVIQQLRSGAVDGVHYERVILVGHSLGSLIAWYEAAEYGDVDAVISSGILHTFDGPAVAQFGTTLYPAAFDPRFAGTITDPGYLTTMPGTRARTFYHQPNADPEVIATDERLKETATMFEARDVFGQELPGSLGGVRDPLCVVLAEACETSLREFWFGVTARITVPVLTVVGEFDRLLCGTGESNRCANFHAIADDEARYFRGPTQRTLEVVQVPNAGHDLNLHRNAPAWFALANTWVEAS